MVSSRTNSASRQAFRRDFKQRDTPAYALSVHKSQGSKSPSVVRAILGEHAAMLQRNLLYTAITRARRLLVIFGESLADLDSSTLN
ncbi:MAG: ATP-binding domain-containing protein [Candidatus Atribacteria bacterium]|nr:ATP-binding domain-containing protein [Candidatus Atribacteria bacterium]